MTHLRDLFWLVLVCALGVGLGALIGRGVAAFWIDAIPAMGYKPEQFPPVDFYTFSFRGGVAGGVIAAVLAAIVLAALRTAGRQGKT
jgi:hypothetical protein